MPKGPVRQVDTSFEGKVGTAVKFVNKNLMMIEADPTVRLTALADLLCLELVTSLADFPEHVVRQKAFQLFRLRMNEAQQKLRVAKAMMNQANDE